MPSWAGTGMVTTCTLTFVIRSTPGISIVSPGWRTAGWARPSRNTTPRSIWRTTRALKNHDARNQMATPARISSRTSMTTSRTREPMPLRGYAGNRERGRVPQDGPWTVAGHPTPLPVTPSGGYGSLGGLALDLDLGPDPAREQERRRQGSGQAEQPDEDARRRHRGH